MKVVDEQGLSGIWLFPTLGVLYEELIRTDIEACTVMMQAFNRWLADDWGYAYQDKIFGAPYLCLGDPAAAAAEVEKVVGLGARVVVMRPAPVTISTGKVSPFSKTFDPVWSAINEAGITVVVHAAASGYSSMGYVADSRFSAGGLSRSGGYMGPNLGSFAIERAAQDWLIQSVFEKLYDRFPRLRVASVENGSDFLAPMFRQVRTDGQEELQLVQRPPRRHFQGEGVDEPVLGRRHHRGFRAYGSRPCHLRFGLAPH